MVLTERTRRFFRDAASFANDVSVDRWMNRNVSSKTVTFLCGLLGDESTDALASEWLVARRVQDYKTSDAIRATLRKRGMSVDQRYHDWTKGLGNEAAREIRYVEKMCHENVKRYPDLRSVILLLHSRGRTMRSPSDADRIATDSNDTKHARNLQVLRENICAEAESLAKLSYELRALELDIRSIT